MLRLLYIRQLLNSRLPLLAALLLVLLSAQSIAASAVVGEGCFDTHTIEAPISVGDESHHQETDSHLLLRTQQHRTVRNAATAVALNAVPQGRQQSKVQTGFQPRPWIEYASPHLSYIHRFFLF